MATPRLFPQILAAEIDGRAHNVQYRQVQFNRLQSNIVLQTDELTQALLEWTGHTLEEVRAEICLALDEIRTHYDSLDAEKNLQEEYSIFHGKDFREGKRGVGIVYIVPIGHTIFFSAISAIAAALAAGNCVILELKGNAPIIKLLQDLLIQALDRDTFAISEKRPDDAFLRKTLLINQEESMSSRVAAVVDRSADIAKAADRLVSARFAFGGASPYSPDIVLVHEAVLKSFLEETARGTWKYCAMNAKRSFSSESVPELLSKTEKNPDAQVIVTGTGWGVMKVDSRESQLLQGKLNERVLLIHPCTSPDDAIEAARQNGPFAASYIFADPTSAKYLAQYIDARVSWVNHVPTEMLVGPLASDNSPLGPSTRYSPATFEIQRSQIVTETNISLKMKTLLHAGSTQSSEKLWREALTPLKPTRQPLGKSIGHFEQGIITGGVLTLTSLLAMTGTLVYYMGKYGSNYFA